MIYSGYQIKGKKFAGSCSMHGGEESLMSVLMRKPKVKDCVEHPGIY
jgi:hypothetical protein